MSEKSSHKELSVDDFYNLLKSRESDKSWTLGQLIEYERRGPRDFDHDIKLVSTLDSYISEQNQKYSEILKPYKEIISKALAGSISQSTRHIFEQ